MFHILHNINTKKNTKNNTKNNTKIIQKITKILIFYIECVIFFNMSYTIS